MLVKRRSYAEINLFDDDRQRKIKELTKKYDRERELLQNRLGRYCTCVEAEIADRIISGQEIPAWIKSGRTKWK